MVATTARGDGRKDILLLLPNGVEHGSGLIERRNWPLSTTALSRDLVCAVATWTILMAACMPVLCMVHSNMVLTALTSCCVLPSGCQADTEVLE